MSSSRTGIKICVAGATGWVGSLVTKTILKSKDFELTGAIAQKHTGHDIGEVLGIERVDIQIVDSLEKISASQTDVLIDYTKPDSVKARTLCALEKGIRVVIGTSGLSATDYLEIKNAAESKSLGVIAAGNFSITAALAKHFALIAAQYLPTWEIIDYAHADKVDAPSGTTRELAEALATVKVNKIEHPIEKTIGFKDARGANIAGTQIHSLRVPGFIIAFETVFGQSNERLTIRHDAGSGADPYVNGTLLAVKKVMETKGLVRGLDTLLFKENSAQ